MPTAAPAPASTMPSGEVMARATRGVRKRSRKREPATNERQKLEITAVSTASMDCGSPAS